MPYTNPQKAKDGYRRSPDNWERIKRQGGVCAFCGEPPRKFRLDVEHDHGCCKGNFSCGECIRGLVHRRCNSFIGIVEKYTKQVKKYTSGKSR